MKFDEFLNENPEYKEKYERLTDEEKQQLTEAVKTVEKIWESLFPTIRELANQVVKMCQQFLSLYPNKRVVHLAVRSKKARVRKKNMNRILKDVQRYSRENKKVI